MTLFLGYDPGGKGKNGVAAIRVVSDVPEVVATATVRDAAEALLWLEAYAKTAVALGIDTLLAWSPKGGHAMMRFDGNMAAIRLLRRTPYTAQ